MILLVDYAFIVSEAAVTVVHQGKAFTVARDASQSSQLVELIKEGAPFAKILPLLEVKSAVLSFGQGALDIRENSVFYKGQEVHNHVVDRILRFVREGLPWQNMAKFLERLLANPSFNSVNQLYSFLEHHNMPLTEEGKVLGYKAVRGDYKDKHSGKFDNSPGSVNEMARPQVDDNPQHDCSAGYHVGSVEYATNFAGPGDRMVIVEFDPADAVSVPSHDTNKLRVCRYRVVADFEGPMESAVHSSRDARPYEYSDPWEDEEEEEDDTLWDEEEDDSYTGW